ncbi:hypothetical protein [uncultured Maribacter sp.]|uniref:hypothetical protein n=1 Tax=uncultured Maribacter sp. TaxID=431308 RepID=UPI0030DB1ECC|tara:strand:+ start:4036 stop:5577 length:1542 start_codon:yes stop_codon:yes gene_type:complete
MKIVKLILLLTILFNTGYHCYAQPGEESDKKYNIHEIKLYEREDGSKAGAIAWNTAAPDSVQKFVIRNLSIMEPVQVLLQALSPNDEVTLQFVKEKWSEPESSISAKGKTIGKKIFRTYKTAAMAIQGKKAGVPYIIVIQVGKKFPMNSTPLFKITDDKNEYENLLKGKGLIAKSNKNIDSNSGLKDGNGEGNTSDSSYLLYIIIGLLALMVIFLGYFVFVRRGSKKILFFILLFGLSFSSSAQSDSPITLSQSDINKLLGLDDVFSGKNNEDRGIVGGPVNSGIPIKIAEMDGNYTEEEFKEMVMQMRDEFIEFKEEFAEGMPGEGSDGGPQRIPPGISQEELNRIRSRIQTLESQVAFLSERDRGYAPPEDSEEQIPIFCENIEECMECITKRTDDVLVLYEKFYDLNSILTYNDWLIETAINEGNNLANMAPSLGLGWQSQHLRLLKTRKDIWIAYHDKYGELLERVERIEQNRETCLKMFETDGFAVNWREMTKDIIRDQTPELVTPLF